jgi:nucleoside-diphosphate-sugar epimerase
MTHSILVTGGAGYLGSIMVPELLRLGHQVTVLDNFMYRQNSLAQVCNDPKFEVVDGDARLRETLLPLLKKADVVIPLAAFVGAPLCNRDPIGATAVNRDAILMLLKMIGREQRILMPTTNSAYGSGGKDNQCDENSPLNPVSHYAREKVEIEQALMQHPNAISFRLATVFGMSPRMRIDLLVNDFTYRAVTDRSVILFESHFKRNYIHVRDVTNAFVHGLDKFDLLRGQIYNVGLSSANISKRELCELIARIVPGFTFLDAPVGKDADQRNYIVSNAKIEATGFVPRHSVEDGVRELIKGYRMLRNTVYGNV